MRAICVGGLILAVVGFAGAAWGQGPHPRAFRTEVPNQSAGAIDELNRRTLGKPRIVLTEKRFLRANHAAALINQGHCTEAYDLAVAEKDMKLAARVTEVCSGKRS